MESRAEDLHDQVLVLLKFDIHYLYVLQYAARLAKAVPRGIDPLDLGERNQFAKGLKEIFWRRHTDIHKFPAPRDLLRQYHEIQEKLRNPPPPPPIRDLPWVESHGASGHMTFCDSNLAALVTAAKIGWYALPVEFSQAYVGCGKLNGPAPPANAPAIDKLVWNIEDLASRVSTQDYASAAKLVLACLYSSGASDPEEVVRKNLDAAKKEQGDAPWQVYCDHRNWELLRSEFHTSHAGSLALSRNANQVGLSESEVMALL